MNIFSKRMIRLYSIIFTAALTVQLLCGCNSGNGNETLPPDISIKYPSNGDVSSDESQTSASPVETFKQTDINTETNAPINFEYMINISAYLKYIDVNDPKYLMLVNKKHVLGKDYEPENLTKLNASLTLYGKEIWLDNNAAKAAEAMIAEMRACGFNNIYITSGHRSYSYQSTLYNTYFAQEKAKHPTWSDERIKEEVLTYSAYPGTSEHQSGLCMDLFVSPGMTSLVNYGSETTASGDIGFAESKEYDWLLKNAYKFGFILRYEKSKESVTGYSYESWHYRFVGRETAAKMQGSGKCFEEYLGKVN